MCESSREENLRSRGKSKVIVSLTAFLLRSKPIYTFLLTTIIQLSTTRTFFTMALSRYLPNVYTPSLGKDIYVNRNIYYSQRMFTTIRAVLRKQGQLIVKEQVSPVTVWLIVQQYILI